MPHTPTRRQAGALLLAALAAAPARAQGFPDRPIRLVVPFAPGGASDVTARLTALHVGAGLGRPVVVENRAGAATVIGSAEVSRAAPDGYTLLLAPPPFVITQFAYPNLPYDPETAFRPVVLLVTGPTVLYARAGLATGGWPEILAMAKARPGALTYATPGNGSLPHVAFELLKLRAGIDVLHVPFRGGGPAAAELAAGRIDLMIASPLEMTGHVDAGRAVPVAATTEARARAYPSVPSLAELGVRDYAVASWFGIVAPAATPDAVVARLNAAYRAALALPEVGARFAQLGVEPAGGPPEAFAELLAAERTRWREAVAASGVRVE